jgi:hypothetical protein
MDISLAGWDIKKSESEWMPWTGSAGEARAKILGAADGYTVVLVEAQPGYSGNPHVHAHPEFNYVVARDPEKSRPRDVGRRRIRSRRRLLPRRLLDRGRRDLHRDLQALITARL